MPTPSKGPRLGGSAAHERLMLANLATALFEHRAITTTEHRAKRVQPLADKLVSKAKRGDLHARRTVMKTIRRKDVVAALFEELAPKFEGREGGYTRITKLPPRKGDNAPMALIELVLEPARAKKAPARKAAPKKEAPKPVAETVDPVPAVEAEDAVEVAEAAEAVEAADEASPKAAK